MNCPECGHPLREHERKYVREEEFTELWCHSQKPSLRPQLATGTGSCDCWTWAQGKYPNLQFEPKDGIQHAIPA